MEEKRKLPDGWWWARLGDVGEEQTSTRDPRSEPEQQFHYIDITSVDNTSRRMIAPRIVMGREAPSRARQIVRAGDVLVATTGPNLNAVALVLPELDNEVCSTGFCVLRQKPGLDPQYLFGLVQSREFVEGLSNKVRGAMYPAVTGAQVFGQVVPLPPLNEQKRIAAILNEQMVAVERARKAVEEELDTISKLPAALLRRAFNGEL